MPLRYQPENPSEWVIAIVILIMAIPYMIWEFLSGRKP
jgi:hypothetical protein